MLANNRVPQSFGVKKVLLLGLAVLLPAPILQAADLNLSKYPPYIGNIATPNVMYTLDDSGSMNRDYMPDTVGNNDCKVSGCNRGEPPYYSKDYNTLFYNPEITYSPAVNADGTFKTSQTSTNTTTWTSVSNDGFLTGAGTSNLASGFRDIQYCGYPVITPAVVLYDGNLPNSGTPSISKSGNTVTVKISNHGLSNGAVIDINNGSSGSCSSGYRQTGATVTVVDANTFRYNDSNNNTSNSNCKIEIPAVLGTTQTCYRNGINTNNPFEYRVPPSPTADVYTTYGLPDASYTSASNVSTNAFFYVIIPTEYCSDKALTTCVASIVPTGTDIYPARVRYCSSSAFADANAPVSGTDATGNVKCQAKRDATYTFPRYGKFYRQDIVSGNTYTNAFVNSTGTILTSSNPTATGYTMFLDRTNRTDCTTNGAGNCTYAEEMTNFANWHTYYRTRLLMAKTSSGRAFNELGQGAARVGYGSINTQTTSVDGVNGMTVQKGVRIFKDVSTTKNYRTQFFTALYAQTINSSHQYTPLRRALDDVGQYFMRSDAQSPWADDPAVSTGDPTKDSACRKSFNVLVTDGYWNDAAANVATGNVDNTGRTVVSLPTSYTYVAEPPYKDAYSGTLADVAMYYWNHDLRSNLDNVVNTTSTDPAYWQHLTDYTVSLGMAGTLTYPDDLQYLKLATTATGHKDWPDASTNTGAERIDDLWHAAVNSRGLFFTAQNPTQLADSLAAALKDAKDQAGAGGAVSIDSASLSTNLYVYQAQFSSGSWTGHLYAKAINLSTGVVSTTPTWDAQTQLSAQNWDTGRKIATFVPGTGTGTGGVAFRWGNLSTAQQALLNVNPDTAATDSNGQNRVDWLRGKAIAGMRSRTNVASGNLELLGDMVDSSPVYVGAPSASYPNYWAGGSETSYSTFKSSQASRAERIYVGANDGMLHAFDASASGGGSEVFAFVPNAVMKNLNYLTSSTFTSSHKYYVNATPAVQDVFFNSTWHTVLVGGLGGGGQGIYALDVTQPSPTNEAAAAGKVLWEIDDTTTDSGTTYTYSDLGYTFGKPTIARMRNGKWVAIFGNGYNNQEADGNASSTGDAFIYVVDIQTGALIKKFDTQVGLSSAPTSLPYSNGIAYVAAIAPKGDSIVDYLYAGDLYGNVWKIDVTSANPANWDFAYTSGIANTPVPLFIAKDASGVEQPITGGIDVGRNASYPNSGFMVYFGTGKYLEPADNSATNQQTQTFYGVWDNGKTGVRRTHLLEQKVIELIPAPPGGYESRVTTNNPIIWHTGTGLPTGSPPTDHMGWYIDLANHDPAITFDNMGERDFGVPFVLNGRVVFTSYLPSTDQCNIGGSGWLWELNAETGSRLDQSPFDINNDTFVDTNDLVQPSTDMNGDGVVDSKDKVAAGASHVRGPNVTITKDAKKKIVSGVGGEIQVISEDPGSGVTGRQSWIRLQ